MPLNACIESSIHSSYLINHFILTKKPFKTDVNSLGHICLSKLNIIGSDNGLSPGQRQAIIWTNARILSIRPLATNFNEFLNGIQENVLENVVCEMASILSRPQCVKSFLFSPSPQAILSPCAIDCCSPDARLQWFNSLVPIAYHCQGHTSS